jgi:hypothetical protein
MYKQTQSHAGKKEVQRTGGSGVSAMTHTGPRRGPFAHDCVTVVDIMSVYESLSIFTINIYTLHQKFRCMMCTYRYKNELRMSKNYPPLQRSKRLLGSDTFLEYLLTVLNTLSTVIDDTIQFGCRKTFPRYYKFSKIFR